MEDTVSHIWRTLSRPPLKMEVYRGLDGVWHQTAGFFKRLTLGSQYFMRQADDIASLGNNLEKIADRQLDEMIASLRVRFQLGRDTDHDRHRAFALLREVAARTVGLRPYREQLAAALAMETGCIAELATGEGKTLVAALAAVLGGWRGKGCHVITANDYLADRDADLMKPIYNRCGLTVGCVVQGLPTVERRFAYNNHVTYGTNKEVAADFLRDRLVRGNRQGLPSVLLAKMADERRNPIAVMVQRGLACAIVDEADAVFIDDAATPLLISGLGPNQEQVSVYQEAARLANKLDSAKHYTVDMLRGAVRLTMDGKRRLSAKAGTLGGVWAGQRRREELIRQALAAKTLFKRGKHYVIDTGKIVIVDEFTGRLMPDRFWRDGLHQAMEAKEGLDINLPRETRARISFQRFFGLYHKLSGMSGTVSEARPELWRIYRSPVVTIPSHRTCQRVIMPERFFTNAATKREAVIESIIAVRRIGRPVLVGTGSVQESEILSELMTTSGVKHCLLNANRQATEAGIIAKAGQRDQVTVATNMAGRGTDIRLGEDVVALGGLHVIATERFEARRIDRQLFGRCARQGDPGSVQAFTSLEDDLLGRHARMISIVLRRIYGNKGIEISSNFWRWQIQALQRRAERSAARTRQGVLAADDWLDEHLGFAAEGI